MTLKKKKVRATGGLRRGSKAKERVVGVDFAVVVNGRAGSNGWLGVTAY